MPDCDLPDGDVLVSPRHLAGPRYTGDPALQPLLDLGWELRYDDLGNVYLSAPDQRVRLGYLPEGDDDALWRITAYDDPFSSPHWATTFNDTAPIEFVTAFTTAYTDGPGAYLYGGGAPSPHRAMDPLLAAGWRVAPLRHLQVLDLAAPDGMAGLTYDKRPLTPQGELTSNNTRWLWWGGPANGRMPWYATHSTHTPLALITATSTAIADPTPALRWNAEIPDPLRAHARITQLTPPRPPVPTPLDIHRTQVSRARTPAATVSVPRWSTSTRTPRGPASPGPAAPSRRC